MVDREVLADKQQPIAGSEQARREELRRQLRATIHDYTVNWSPTYDALAGKLADFIIQRERENADRLNGVLCDYCGRYWPAMSTRGTYYDGKGKLHGCICDNCLARFAEGVSP